MASLQARHSRGCAIEKPWTTFETAVDGCTCTGGPTYYVVVRDGRRKREERVGKNRQTAERALRKIGTQLDEGSYTPQRRIRFDAWADQWHAGLEVGTNTKHSYLSTVGYAKAAFADKDVRRLDPGDVARMNERMRVAGLSDSTRAKHLRVLHACLEAAVARGYAGTNAVSGLQKSERPRSTKKEAAYFENDELPRLFEQLADTGVYRVLCLLALKTGMRLGELTALRWGDVDTLGAVIHVRRSWTNGNLGSTKGREKREVDITSDVVELLGGWWGALGNPGDEKLVLPGATRTGYLNDQVVRKNVLYPAMAAAGIDRVGPTGEKRTFHSFRHSFAKVALEGGRPIAWLSRHLGHSSVAITDGVYGHSERASKKREVEAMVGAFGV